MLQRSLVLRHRQRVETLAIVNDTETEMDQCVRVVHAQRFREAILRLRDAAEISE